jgi:hypothetical protein
MAASLSKRVVDLFTGIGAVVGITFCYGCPIRLTVLVIMFGAHIGNKIRRGGGDVCND